MQARSRTSRALLTAAVAGGLAFAGAGQVPATAAKPDPAEQLTKAVTLKGLTKHLQKFDKLAEKHGDRFAGYAGHEAAAKYAQKVFEKAGYKTWTEEFEYLAFAVKGPAILEQVAPTPTAYVEDEDYTYIEGTDPGDVTAEVTAVDLALGLDNTSTSGCEAEDFADFPEGDIALLQRGTCPFEDKAENAAAAGAVGAVIMNQGNTDAEDRNGLIGVTLGATNTSGIPVLFSTYEFGAALSEIEGLSLRIKTDTIREERTTPNVLAESKKRHLKKPKSNKAKKVVMVGAHLDGVSGSAAINDNATGSAAILEIAKQMKNVKTRHKVRFALWTAEESGLIGAEEYVAGLTPKQADKIALYLNFDMIGSPNFVRFVYDGDNSAFPPGDDAAEAPKGSGIIEQAFHDYFEGRKLASAETEFSGRSDYGPFIDIGIPSGGLFTGAEGIKTEEEAKLFGGTAGKAYDECYHEACDDMSNYDKLGFHQMADAAAYAVATFAMDASSVIKANKGTRPAPSTRIIARSSHSHGDAHGHAIR